MILDRVYSAKAAHGMVMEMQNNPGRFKGTRILFLHTGTVFYTLFYTLIHTGTECV